MSLPEVGGIKRGNIAQSGDKVKAGGRLRANRSLPLQFQDAGAALFAKL
ncbi:MAG: hypothetical protein Q4C01_04450 [Clostridia bacterium]|nr:hypothetical protein [Clostridia bacterium]